VSKLGRPRTRTGDWLHCRRRDHMAPQSEFRRLAPNGIFDSWCKSCRREYNRDYWRKRRDREQQIRDEVAAHRAAQ
jgi:hypothetical protein